MSGFLNAFVGGSYGANPGAPTITSIELDPNDPTFVSIYYSAPNFNGGSEITQYTATSSPGGFTGTVNQSGSGMVQVLGLSPETTYSFTVTATNSFGTGPASASSTITTGIAPPALVTAPVVTGNAWVGSTLSCNTGTWTGTGITYTYQWYYGAVSPTTILSGATSSTYTISNTYYNNRIRCRVTATNSAGSVSSYSSNNVGPVIKVADAPTIGTATVTGTTTATVSYTAPAVNGGSTITSYRATSNPGGIIGTLNQAASGTITVSGLTAGTAYTFTVTAINGAGTSAASSASNSITTYAVPANTAAPVLTGTAYVGQTLSVTTGTWTGNPTPTYTYQWFRGASTISAATSSSYLLVSGDLGNTIYCRVTATNSVGTTNANSNSTGTVITTAGAPTIGTATVTGTTTATVAFTAPASNGGSAITSYTAVSSPSNITGTLSQAGSGTITVSGLSPNTAYTFTVYATNGAGNSASSAASNSITTNSIPINTANAAISGTTQFGQTLTTSNGTWTGNPASYTYSYQWRRSGTNISGATSSTYTLVSADVGATITCAVSATNASGTNTTITAATAVISATTPNAPTIGTATVASTTTATLTFTESTNDGGSGITSHYVFANPAVGGGQIVGSSPVTVTGLTPGTSYTFTVATNNGVGTSPQSAASNSITTYKVPVNTSVPVITGTTTSGSILSCSTGSWSAVPAPSSYTYQWKRSGTDISGATSSTYTLIAADVGNTITCSVTATNSVGTSSAAVSAATSTIITIAGAPTIGTATATGTTTATVAFTAPASNGSSTITSYTAVSSPGGITGTLSQATSGTITVSGLTSNTAYTFTVYATNGAGNSASSASSNSITTSAVVVAPTNTSVPTISGTAQVGQTLTAGVGSWSGSPTGYAYQWLRAGSAISGATSSTYTLIAADAGNAIAVTITASNSAGSAAATSANTSTVIVAAPTNVSAPSITGNAWVGQTLTAVGGGWTGSPTSYAYQWLRAGTNISGATSNTYVVTATDLGNVLALRVTATNAGGSTAATSGNTATVITTADAPTIGTATVTGTTTATVAFTAPANNGGSAITSYTAVASSGGVIATLSQAGSGTITVSGLSAGTAYTFTVYAVNAAGAGSSSAASNSITTYSVPANTVAPTISGSIIAGGTATMGTGTWTGNPTPTYTYQWYRGATVISGATSQSYVITRTDIGSTVNCTITATNSVGSASVNATTYANAVGSPDAPTIGTATATGSTTATVAFTAPASNGGGAITSYTATSSPGGITGTLSQAGSGTISISGLTASTAYTFTVTATNSYGTSVASSASNSITTDAGVAAPTNSQAPTVTGTPTEGQQLIASVGIWTGSPTYTYQWLRAGTSISGATSSSYTLVSADVGNGIAVRVTATNAGGSTQATSAYTSAVAGQQFTLVAATVTPMWGNSSTATHPPTGWTSLQNASADDANVSVSIPGLYFSNSSYTTCYIGSNSYITFGAGSNVYSALSATNPAVNKIMIQAADNSYQRVSALSSTGATVGRIRFEGAASTSGTPGASGMIWEVAFFSSARTGGSPWIEIRIGSMGRTGAINGIYSSAGANLIQASGSVTFTANQSYVLVGNSIGTSWIVYSGYYVNTNGLG